jgi:hypothetical protein
MRIFSEVMQNFGINGAWIGLSNEWNDTWHNEKPIKYKNFGISSIFFKV